MIREITMKVPALHAVTLEDFLRSPPSDCGRDEVLFDKEVIFSDGVRAAVQVIAPNSPEDGDTAWSQCVLFNANGKEISVSEPGDALIGPFRMNYFDDTYIVNVVAV